MRPARTRRLPAHSFRRHAAVLPSTATNSSTDRAEPSARPFQRPHPPLWEQREIVGKAARSPQRTGRRPRPRPKSPPQPAPTTPSACQSQNRQIHHVLPIYRQITLMWKWYKSRYIRLIAALKRIPREPGADQASAPGHIREKRCGAPSAVTRGTRKYLSPRPGLHRAQAATLRFQQRGSSATSVSGDAWRV